MDFAHTSLFQRMRFQTTRAISIRPLFFSSDGGMAIKLKARYEDAVLKPLEAVDLEEGEEVELELKRGSLQDFHGKLELEEELADEVIELELWD
jgi:predicted DNA-binding antitoxin AbrB/MazE fold protein